MDPDVAFEVDPITTFAARQNMNIVTQPPIACAMSWV